jgi:3-dehydroquinate synthase/shikimate kinase/3-dehydroquinate synthase
MKTFKIQVKTKSKSYNIIIGSNIIIKKLRGNSIKFKKCLLVIDKNVPKKKLNEINLVLKNNKKIKFLFNSNEKNKNEKTVNKLLDLLLKNNFHRNDCIIAIGGGITGDIASYAASIFKRGIKFINIPTTLLSQVDSSIGGKTGINTKYGKNLIGTFYQPDLVISDTSFLKTLSKREIVCGYGEILKHSLIMDKKFFNYLNINANKILKLQKPYIDKTIYRSCLIKKNIVEKDENEKNLRKILNFGHTFAHAYEATKNYSKKLNHGEAVLLGIISASKFAYKNHILNENDYKKIINHFAKFKLPNKLTEFFSTKNIYKILSFMQKDKKNNNDNISLVLLKKIGITNFNLKFKKIKVYKFIHHELIN